MQQPNDYGTGGKAPYYPPDVPSPYAGGPPPVTQQQPLYQPQHSSNSMQNSAGNAENNGSFASFPQQGNNSNPPYPYNPSQGYPNPNYNQDQPIGSVQPDNNYQSPMNPPPPPHNYEQPPAYYAQGAEGNNSASSAIANSDSVEPSAPPPMDISLPGYEDIVGFHNADAPPPTYDEAIGEMQMIESDKQDALDEDAAREALLDYVGQHCCYGKGAAKKMEMVNISSTSALHYTLETFTEKRSTKWEHIPYSSGFVDGPQYGPPPAAWEIPCSFSILFQNETKILEVPHTAYVKTCYSCHGTGHKRCHRCHGRCKIRCNTCNGNGRVLRHDHNNESFEERCTVCFGSGMKQCNVCFGRGVVKCKVCQGMCNLKYYIQLTVDYVNESSDHIVERTELPDHLIRDVSGNVMFEQISQRVGPISNCSDPEINTKSHEIIGRHARQWPLRLILQQRQKLRSVPVFETHFRFDNKEGRFWVYGHQHSVYTDDYPQTCCCGCTIL